jgi:hypothetical protein
MAALLVAALTLTGVLALRSTGQFGLFERDRANLARRCPEMIVSLCARWEHWAGRLPGIPDDARVDVVGGPSDMPRPSL